MVYLVACSCTIELLLTPDFDLQDTHAACLGPDQKLAMINLLSLK